MRALSTPQWVETVKGVALAMEPDEGALLGGWAGEASIVEALLDCWGGAVWVDPPLVQLAVSTTSPRTVKQNPATRALRIVATSFLHYDAGGLRTVPDR